MSDSDTHDWPDISQQPAILRVWEIEENVRAGGDADDDENASLKTAIGEDLVSVFEKYGLPHYPFIKSVMNHIVSEFQRLPDFDEYWVPESVAGEATPVIIGKPGEVATMHEAVYQTFNISSGSVSGLAMIGVILIGLNAKFKSLLQAGNAFPSTFMEDVAERESSKTVDARYSQDFGVYGVIKNETFVIGQCVTAFRTRLNGKTYSKSRKVQDAWGSADHRKNRKNFVLVNMADIPVDVLPKSRRYWLARALETFIIAMSRSYEGKGLNTNSLDPIVPAGWGGSLTNKQLVEMWAKILEVSATHPVPPWQQEKEQEDVGFIPWALKYVVPDLSFQVQGHTVRFWYRFISGVTLGMATSSIAFPPVPARGKQFARLPPIPSTAKRLTSTRGVTNESLPRSASLLDVIDSSDPGDNRLFRAADALLEGLKFDYED